MGRGAMTIANREVPTVTTTSEEARNEQVIRSLYALAEGNVKDTSKFVSMFTDDGYFYEIGRAHV